MRRLRTPSSTRIVEILELALVPDLHRPEIAVSILADADAFGIIAIGAEG